jgi:hypothetical protein
VAGAIGATHTPIDGMPSNWEGWVRPNQYRRFGPDGRAQTDFDWHGDHGFGNPHAHDWDWSDPSNPVRVPRSIRPGELLAPLDVLPAFESLFSIPLPLIVMPKSMCQLSSAYPGCQQGVI